MANKFDLHVNFLKRDQQIVLQKFMSFGFPGGLGVKGFQMLINKWAKYYLTPKGTDPTDLRYGTNFTSLLGSNTTPEDARDIVTLAIGDTNNYCFASQRNQFNLAPTERLLDAKLIRFDTITTAPGFEAYIQLTNQARESLILNLPDFGVQ